MSSRTSAEDFAYEMGKRYGYEEGKRASTALRSLEEAREALAALLDFAERDRGGGPVTVDEWYAVRDAARRALGDTTADHNPPKG